LILSSVIRQSFFVYERQYLYPKHLERLLRMHNDDAATTQTAARSADLGARSLRADGGNQPNEAGHALLREYGPRLMVELRNFFWLSESEKGSVIHDAILEVLKTSQGSGLELDRTLAGLLLRKCRVRAVELSRKQGRMTASDEELAREIAGALTGTKVGLAWKDAMATGDPTAIPGEFCEFVQFLPAPQKRVAILLADHLGWKLSSAEIIRKIYESTGINMSETEVKGALSQIRLKFKAVLKRKHPELSI
jgi:hypothetical protein